MNIVLRDGAIADLESIHAWIAAERPWTAQRVIGRILDSIENLASFPELGRPGKVENTRELVVPRLPYIVVYRIEHDSDAIAVISVVHGARDRP